MKRRDLIRMTPSEEREFLEAGHTAILTSVGRDGLPHPVAMWYVVIDGLVHFATYTKSQKVTNFRRDPAAAVLVEEGRTYEELRGLLIQGQAEVSDDPDLALRVQRGLFEKYTLGVGLGQGSLDEGMETAIRRQAAKRSAVVVPPQRVTSWDHRKLGGGY